MGALFSSGKKQAKAAAAATLEAANMQASSDRLTAQASVQSMQQQIAQTQAADKAAELLSVPQDQVDVQLSTDPTAAEIDPTTGRRKTTRTPFTSSAASSAGISI